MAQMTLKIKKVGMKNPKTKVLGFASRAIANGTQDFAASSTRLAMSILQGMEGMRGFISAAL